MNSLKNKLNKLNAQLKITRGNRAKAKLVIKILAVEAAIEKMNSAVVTKKPVAKKLEFAKKPDKKMLKIFKEKLQGAEIKITENKILLISGSLELSVNTSIEFIPKWTGRRSEAKYLRETQTAKIHALYEVIGTLLLAS